MKEILTMGNVSKDFKRLGVELRQTYNGEDYGVCEVTDEEFELLLNELEDEKYWNECGWRYAKGSNQDVPDELTLINGKGLMVWLRTFEDEDGNEYLPVYDNLLEYLCEHMGASQPKNVCALAIDLAKYNNMKLSELFKVYQG